MVTTPAGDVTAAGADAAAEWDAYVDANAAASGYHSWGWRHVFERAFGHEAIYLVIRRSGRIAGVLPIVMVKSAVLGRFAVSLPFVNYGGVVADDKDAAASLRAAAREILLDRGAGYLEMRHRTAQFPDLPSRNHKAAMLRTLPADEDECWQGLDRKIRNQVRKAEKSDLRVEAGDSELFPDFYNVFARNMRDLGTPVYPRQFFEEVIRQFPERCRVYVIRLGEACVAASITVARGGIVEVPWAASDKRYRDLCPNTLLYWAMLRGAITSGCGTFDFGRSSPGDGPYKFKQQWGATATPLCWEYELNGRDSLPQLNPANPKLRTAIELWKKLPLPVATLFGPHVVRFLP
jgi:FemAB-related protein (PEP-CTERM system-associated)